ncbi:hypothetical protein Q9L58_006940 [Maublancomyces gigas]|uniref:MARVEL domain-containing protein n=1 Tax=Discina gigas TaxID=1032678 RepID=A0ABR3GE97_9PEZI
MAALRGAQGFFSLILLGCSSYVVSQAELWYPAMGVVSSLFTLLYVGANVFLFLSNLLLPLPIVIVDAVLLLFWVITMGGFGGSGFLSISCKFTYNAGIYSPYLTSTNIFVVQTSKVCTVSKAIFTFSFFIFLTFIGSLVISAIILYKNRKDLSGAKHNSGLTPDGELQNMEAGGAPGQVQGQTQEEYAEQKQDYQQPQHPQYQQQQYPQPGADGYYPQQVQSVVSPPQTPAPYQQAQRFDTPPPPPPVGAQELGH